MKSLAVWFEIPVLDMARAKAFYEAVTQLQLELLDMGEMQMAMFPSEGYENSGALTHHEHMKPSGNGVLLYLEAGEDLQPTLDRVEPAGGKVVMPKTEISKDYGWFALFADTEGNQLGLWSPK